ncbi:MAG: hypothetical protein AB7F43_07365 [Bacteriovoracia bacterium]
MSRNRAYLIYLLLFGFILFASSTEISAVTMPKCSGGQPLSKDEKLELLNKLRISNAGKTLILSLQTTKKIELLWNKSSFSEILNSTGRGLVCIHLTKELPQIEHIADLAHELTHITKMSYENLKGSFNKLEDFVASRISAKGGEADAFMNECVVKKEITGHWDAICTPYISKDDEPKDHLNRDKIVDDLYNGELSASLTGEPYPIMLAKQFHSILLHRKQQ